MCDGIRHNYKWYKGDSLSYEGWYCLECLLPWKDDAQRQPIATPEHEHDSHPGDDKTHPLAFSVLATHTVSEQE